jgi:hypothetical protein
MTLNVMELKFPLLPVFIAWACHSFLYIPFQTWKIFAYLFTHSMEQSSSWEANRFSANQEIPCILWNPKVYYRVNKCLTPVPVLSQHDPSKPPPPTFWRSVLILSSHVRLSLQSGLSPSGFPTKTLYTPLLSPPVPHAPPISFFSIWSPE